MMRCVGLSDLDIATRALLGLPRDAWLAHAATLIEEAHIADLYRKRYGRVHPNGGTGSLYAQASLHLRGPETSDSVQYCAALSVVLEALHIWRQRVHFKT